MSRSLFRKGFIASLLLPLALLTLSAAVAGRQAQADLFDHQGKPVGRAVFTQDTATVRIHVFLENLPPGLHGFHIHEQGDFSIPNFRAAGGHFNPFQRKHGFDHPEGPHAGDLPNLNVGENGSVDTTVEAPLVTLEPGPANSLLKPGGTSLIVHAGPDDYYTQPSGASGERIAGGIIREVNP